MLIRQITSAPRQIVRQILSENNVTVFHPPGAGPVTQHQCPQSITAQYLEQRLSERIDQDNVRDDAAYALKTPNLLNIYRSSKL